MTIADPCAWERSIDVRRKMEQDITDQTSCNMRSSHEENPQF